MIGSFVSVCPAVRYCPLYIRFDREKNLAFEVNSSNYDGQMLISAYLKED